MSSEPTDRLDCPNAGIGRFSDLTCCTQVHRHDFFNLVWLGQGKASVFVDFELQDLTAGSLIFITPGQVYAWEETAKDRAVGIIFSNELFSLQGQRFPSFLDQLAYETSSPHIMQVPDQRHPLFDFIFGTAEERCREEDDPRRYEETLLAYLNLALLEIRRLPYESRAEDGHTASATMPLGGPRYQNPKSASRQLTSAFQELVEAHFIDGKKVQEFASMLGVTTNHLVQTVRQQTSKTPGLILQDRLVLEAKRSLIHTGDSVAEIANTLSFPNPSQFGRWFKRVVSVSPGEFRRQFSAFS